MNYLKQNAVLADLEAQEPFRDLVAHHKSLIQTNTNIGLMVRNYYETWSTSPNNNSLLLNGVQLINTINSKGRLFYKYEGIIFNFPQNIKNAIIGVRSLYLETRKINAVITLVKDTFVHFLCDEYIDPELYEFVLIYGESK